MLYLASVYSLVTGYPVYIHAFTMSRIYLPIVRGLSRCISFSDWIKARQCADIHPLSVPYPLHLDIVLTLSKLGMDRELTAVDKERIKGGYLDIVLTLSKPGLEGLVNSGQWIKY